MSMKKYLSILSILSISFYALKAQTPDDALRNGWFIPGGSARNMAIGGAMGSLGGDITANNINPAGIGLYKTSEITLSPGFMLNNNKLNYRGDNSTQSQTAFAYGASGFIAGASNTRGRNNWTSSAFSISINQLASYNNHIHYKGSNNISSFSEQYLEELTRDGAGVQAAEQNYIFGSSLAYRTYLIDSINNNGQLIGYRTLVPISSGTVQENDEKTTGGYHEISIAFAGNMEDKLYLGASINIPLSFYTRSLTYTETDASGDLDNNFGYSAFTENLKSFGVGINAKFGLIYRTPKSLRLGLAIHTPSFMSFTDHIRAAMTTNTEQYAGTLTESSDNLNNGSAGERKYNELTPWRIIGSLSFVLHEVQDTRLQKGFITADVEYVSYRGSRFYTISDENGYSPLPGDYYDALNNSVKDYLKGAFNFRMGGELKFDTWLFRLGGAFYGSPYDDPQLKAHRILASGGIGYLNHGYFIDVTLAHTFNQDVNFPYRLADKPNTFATSKNNLSNVIITFGFKI